MRPYLKPDNLTERLALHLNLAPVVVAEAHFGMPMPRVVIAAQRLGVFRRLSAGPASLEELTGELELDAAGARLLLDSLAALGHVRKDGGRYELAKRDRRWLDPASDTYVGTFIEHCGEFWDWWTSLEDIVRSGESIELHARPADDPRWRVYIRGQFELARLAAPEVGRALRLPAQPKRLLDVAGGHGWFSAELCRRHPGLEATVLDLPGSAAIGREIVAEAGMSERVHHVEGDAFEAELGGPYDAALCFNLIHHFSPERNVELFERIHAALRPGGTFAVLDLFLPADQRRPDASSFLALFFFLTSAAATYSPDDLRDWLREAGFEAPRRVRIRRIPVQTLYEARRAA